MISDIEAQGPSGPPPKRARGSTTGRPIMVALDLLGRRWTLRALWELRDGPLGFRELQARCDAMSSSVLRARLVELEREGLVGRDGAAYTLTATGRGLREAIEPLTAWAERWRAERADPTDATAGPGPVFGTPAHIPQADQPGPPQGP